MKTVTVSIPDEKDMIKCDMNYAVITDGVRMQVEAMTELKSIADLITEKCKTFYDVVYIVELKTGNRL